MPSDGVFIELVGHVSLPHLLVLAFSPWVRELLL